MPEQPSVNISGSNVSGFVAGDISDVSGVVNLGTISGDVSNAIGLIPETSELDKPSLKDLLTQLQEAITAEPALSNEDKAEALEQVKVLAEAGQKPDENTLQKAAKTAMKILKGTVSSLPEAAKLADACAKLLPIVSKLLLFV